MMQHESEEANQKKYLPLLSKMQEYFTNIANLAAKLNSSPTWKKEFLLNATEATLFINEDIFPKKDLLPPGSESLVSEMQNIDDLYDDAKIRLAYQVYYEGMAITGDQYAIDTLYSTINDIQTDINAVSEEQWEQENVTQELENLKALHEAVNSFTDLKYPPITSAINDPETNIPSTSKSNLSQSIITKSPDQYPKGPVV